MSEHRWKLISLFVLSLLLAIAPAALAHNSIDRTSTSPTLFQPPAIVNDGEKSLGKTSHRLTVELESPPLVVWASRSLPADKAAAQQLFVDGRLNVAAPSAQAYVQQLQSEQQAFVSAMSRAIPNARVSTYMDETGRVQAASYQIVMNAVTVDAGRDADVAGLERQLRQLPGVKAVYRDYAHDPALYASIPLINAAAAWNNAAIGGMENAGAGIKVASMDGGVHKDAPMFDGTGYEYPNGYPLGDTRNTNGKIIVSRAYFRTWDPPTPGDENPWPGEWGTSHGVHTASTAAGDEVVATYLGITETISGVAPKAYVMSYRVFYESVTGDGSFYTAEGIAALEDIVADGADVVNNSWGAGPGSSGGAFDPLDAALINAWNAGVFVSMSAGNSGPNLGTGDHPSAEYINVAASTTTGTFAAGRLQVTAPEPVSPTLQTIPYGEAAFGEPLEFGTTVGPFSYLAAEDVDPGNEMGCDPFPSGAFDGKAAIILRGVCDFSTKVLHAQQAGADFAVVYNDAARGDAVTTMSAGGGADHVTISSVFIGYTNGRGLIDWRAEHGDASQFIVDTGIFQLGNTPDVIADFSSRGPGVGNVLKPDIAAPGVNILAQGYDSTAVGEARHLGYGQVSGTSMAAPHVAGAAALLKQIHPTWSNAWIKSALMSTSKYLKIYNHDGSPAQPLDMGAGRLDLTRAADPGIILSPPRLSFGQVVSGTTASLDVTLTSVATETETYEITTLYTGGGFDATTALPGMTVSPSSVTLDPGESTTIEITWDTTASMGYGDNQGYVVFTGSTHEAHMPAWMRVGYESRGADVLIVDNDGSSSLGLPDYTGYYTSTLESLGYTYEVWDADARFGNPATFPDATALARYPTVIYQTGDNYYPDGSFAVSTAPTQADFDGMTEYVNNGGHVIAFGQDLSSAVTSDSFFYGAVLGAWFIQDSVNGDEVYTDTAQLLTGSGLMDDFTFDISAMGDGAGNQVYVDEVVASCNSPDRPEECDVFSEIVEYNDPTHQEESGMVAISHRDHPSLERPGTTFAGSALYFAFGLEGVNNDTGYNTREDLLKRALAFALDSAEVTIAADAKPTGQVTTFTATFSSTLGGPAVGYRWDFGDGSDYTEVYPTRRAGHTYTGPGTYTVRVEAFNALGTTAIGEVEVTVPASGSIVYFPLVIHAAERTAFEATLSGANEVPPVTTEASGRADFTYDPDTRELNYTLSVSGIPQAGITMAHIHRGEAGTNGPVAYWLYDPSGENAPAGPLFPGSPVSGTVTLSEADAELLMSGGLYVNVHTTDYPSGAIRGQIQGR